ncbi:MAG: branched-chain amino acid transport system II carrier protein [Actinomycetaceae bacterium]|nr:branched-chain amino acid transport system II carrier protein [Actinomycetaceae bacterium]
MPATTQEGSQGSIRAIVIAGMALFAMFFGAGNLIFPTMMGVEAGNNLPAAITGFVLTGVCLPALGIVASATSTSGVLGLTERMGKKFGMAFTVVIFLSIGVLYAIPRVATVSYETSLRPFLASSGLDMSVGSAGNGVALAIFTLVFFGVSAWLALNPGKLVDRIGTWLTPALLALLVLLITVGLFTMNAIGGDAVEKYASAPLTVGLVDGYFTMDAMASIVFGGIVIDSLRRAGFTGRAQIFTSTVSSGIVAGVLLGGVYIGLANLGARVQREGIETGADALSKASRHLFGATGQIVFGAIVFLACLTTAVGLIGASTKFFREFFPKINQPTMVMIHVFISGAIANLGLAIILQIIGPITLFIYPITIAVITVGLVDIVIPGQLSWAYKIAGAVATVFGAWSSLRAMGLLAEGGANDLWSLLPMHSVDMAWVVPSALGLAVGLVIDGAQGRFTRDVDETVKSVETQEETPVDKVK